MFDDIMISDSGINNTVLCFTKKEYDALPHLWSETIDAIIGEIYKPGNFVGYVYRVKDVKNITVILEIVDCEITD